MDSIHLIMLLGIINPVAGQYPDIGFVMIKKEKGNSGSSNEYTMYSICSAQTNYSSITVPVEEKIVALNKKMDDLMSKVEMLQSLMQTEIKDGIITLVKFVLVPSFLN